MSRPLTYERKKNKKDRKNGEITSTNSSSAISFSSSSPQPVDPVSFDDTTTGVQQPTDSSPYTTLDCRLLEGGGQTLRISLALASLFSLPLRLTHIRANRPKGGGLAAQHLCGVLLVSQIARARVNGATIGSQELTFFPSPLEKKDDSTADTKDYLGDVKTAGSTLLLLQISLPVLIFLPHSSSVTLRGGTHATLAPPFDFFTSVFLPILRKHTGIKVEAEIVRYGFFPRGGGEIKVSVQPVQSNLSPIILIKRGTITHITGIIVVAGRFTHAHAMIIKNSATSTLRSNSLYKSIPVEIEVSVPSGGVNDSVLFLLLLAHTSTECILSYSIIGERGDTPQSVGTNCMNNLLSSLSHGGCVDEYMQDQLLIYAALAYGVSRVKIGELSLHTRTAVHWIQILSGASVKLRNLTEDEKENTDNDKFTQILEIEGIGYGRGITSNPSLKVKNS